jgi:hypothetical protein
METLEPFPNLGDRPSARRGVWLALSLSLAAHALFVMGMCLSAAGQERGYDDDSISSIVVEPVRLMMAVEDRSARGDNDARPSTPPSTDVPVVSVSSRPAATVTPLAPASSATSPASEPNPASSGTDIGSAAGSAHTAFFGVSTPGKRVVYLIDRSISMGLNGALPLAKHELMASLRRLPADARFQLLVYNRFAEPLVANGAHGLLSPSADVLERIAALLEPLRAEGGTNHLVALQRALQLQPEVIYLVTDGDDLSAEQIRTVAALNRSRAVINTIEIGYAPVNREAGPLEQLARQNGGVFRVISLPGLTSR